jgi:hypothetical protein
MKAEVQIYKSLKSSNSKLRDDKNKISKAIKAAQELISFNKEIYPAEKIFLSSLMAKISTSTPENLILTLIENNINEKIILKGWSIDAEAANDFSEKLAEYTQETNIIVQTPLISGGKPFFGVEGYGFEMELFMVEKGF